MTSHPRAVHRAFLDACGILSTLFNLKLSRHSATSKETSDETSNSHVCDEAWGGLNKPDEFRGAWKVVFRIDQRNGT